MLHYYDILHISLFFIGILCGECEEGGVSVLLNNCVTCSNNHLTLILVLSKLYIVDIVNDVFISSSCS